MFTKIVENIPENSRKALDKREYLCYTVNNKE